MTSKRNFTTYISSWVPAPKGCETIHFISDIADEFLTTKTRSVLSRLRKLPAGSLAVLDWEPEKLHTPGPEFNNIMGGYGDLMEKASFVTSAAAYDLPPTRHVLNGSEEWIHDRTVGGMTHEVTRHQGFLAPQCYFKSEEDDTWWLEVVIKNCQAVNTRNVPIIPLLWTMYPPEVPDMGFKTVREQQLYDWAYKLMTLGITSLAFWFDGYVREGGYLAESTRQPDGRDPKIDLIRRVSRKSHGNKFALSNGNPNMKLIEQYAAEDAAWAAEVVNRARQDFMSSETAVRK